MGRSIIFYFIAAVGLGIVALSADDIEGRHSEGTLLETALVIGGVLLAAQIVRALIERIARKRREAR